ncbi:beta-propeller fold lactonase family protein [Verrucomicrobiota bacterium]
MINNNVSVLKLGLAAAYFFVLFASAGLCDYSSPIDLAADKEGKRIYVAEHTANRVAVCDVAQGKIVQRISLPDRPGGLVLSRDASSLFVTGASPDGRVHIISLADKKISASIPVGHTPVSPVISPDGKTLYVCNRFNNNVSVIALGSGKETARIPVTREPVAAALTPDGKFLFVANHLAAGAADGDFLAAVVSVIDTERNKVCSVIQLPNGSTGIRGICVSPDGKTIYVTHILARYQVPTTQLDRGWMNTNALTIIDALKKKRINTVLLDDVNEGAANPWGVACTDDGKYICVAHAGTHEISVIDQQQLLQKLAEREKDNISNDLGFLKGMRRRLKLTGNGPRALIVIGSKVYVTEYFSDTIGIIDINPSLQPQPRSIALGAGKSLDKVRKGEMFFNDASLCFQHWQSCASCHPDVRADGLNWDLLNDGVGNPRQVKSLLLSHKTPPVMITGIRDKAETAVRAGIRYIQFAIRPEEDAEAIDEYLKSLKPVPSPYLVNGRLSESAERGEKIFETAGCAGCHPAPLYTDLRKYDVGTGKREEKNRAFDVPTIIESWRTAPFLIDGRAATIKEIFTKYNKDNKHGRTSGLSEKDMNDLVMFILSQ